MVIKLITTGGCDAFSVCWCCQATGESPSEPAPQPSTTTTNSIPRPVLGAGTPPEPASIFLFKFFDALDLFYIFNNLPNFVPHIITLSLIS